MIQKYLPPKIDLFSSYRKVLEEVETIRPIGKVVEVEEYLVVSEGPEVAVGELCYIEKKEGDYILAEARGFKEEKLYLFPLEKTEGIYPGARVVGLKENFRIPLTKRLLSRVVDAFGNPLDGKGKLYAEDLRREPVEKEAISPLERVLIEEPLFTGIRAIDAFLTLGKGQRVGIFAGSGVGKSTLLGMLSRGARADVVIIALIGERGREVKEFIEWELPPQTRKKTVVVVEDAKSSPFRKVKAAFSAMRIAEFFRDQGKDVLFLMDSLTRLAMAQRELGLSLGEPPSTRGYPPSTFSLISSLAERAGKKKEGSITAIFTVLVEGDDLNEPISDSARGVLDGHIVLSRRLANKGHYPAIDITSSISRLMPYVIDKEFQKKVLYLRELLSLYEENEDMISLGAYARGSIPDLDKAIDIYPHIRSFLRQDRWEITPFEETKEKIEHLYKSLEEEKAPREREVIL